MALSIVDEKEAAEVFSYLQQMGDLAELDPPGDAADAASRP